MVGMAKLSDLLRSDDIIVVPGIYDTLSALIIERAGFEAIYLSGGAVARSMGFPDLGLITLTEMVQRAREIAQSVNLPLIADADTGYGNAINVMRTMQEFERAGVAAIQLEDQVTPKKCGHYHNIRVLPEELMVGKLQAALEARSDHDLLIVARTDSLSTHGFDEAIRRANLYADVGADVIFVEAPQTREQLRQIPQLVQAPLLVNMFQGGKTPLVSVEELHQMGYKMVIIPSDLQRAAIKAMQEVASVLRKDGNSASISERLVTFTEREELVDLPKFQQLDRRFVHLDQEKGSSD